MKLQNVDFTQEWALLCIPDGIFVCLNGGWRVGKGSPSGYTIAMKFHVNALRLLALALLTSCLLPLAHAQWSWKDKEGRRIFSDQPPPIEVPDKDIFRRPAGARAPAAAPGTITATASVTTASSPSSGTSTSATLPKISGKDSELEKKKKEAEAKEAALKKAEAEKISAQRKENCERAKRAKASFDTGQRMSTINAQGEREVMNDATRASETKRLQDIINSDCT